MPEFLREPKAGTPRIRPIGPGQESQASRLLTRVSTAKTFCGPCDEVVLSVAWHYASSDIGQLLGDRHHVRMWPRQSVRRGRCRMALQACRRAARSEAEAKPYWLTKAPP